MNKTQELPTFYPHYDEYQMVASMLDSSKHGIIIPMNCLSQVLEKSNFTMFSLLVPNDNPELVEIKVTLR